MVFNQLSEYTRFKIKFDSVYTKLSVGINVTKKQPGYIIDFLVFKFDIFKIKACLPLDKFKKTIEK